MCKRTASPDSVAKFDDRDDAPSKAAAAPEGWDHALGRRLCAFCGRHPVFKAAVDVLSLTGDEGVWYAVSSPLITLGFAFRGLAALAARRHITQASCVEEIGCDIFGTMSFALTFETAGKLLVKRPRPPYVAQNCETYVIPGEEWSMPSGHAIRAVVLAFWLAYGKNAALICATLGVPAPPIAATLVWALLVGVSRVLKGRHFPTDVLAGLVIGLGVGFVLEGPQVALTNYWRGVPKVFGGICICGAWGCTYFVPLLGRATGAPIKVLIALYFLFYCIMLYFSVPRTEAGWDFGACGHDY